MTAQLETSIALTKALWSNLHGDRKKEAAALIVRINTLFVQAMGRQWGSCNPATMSLRLNTQLAHLKGPTHGEEFVAVLDSLQQDWQERRRLLNNLPGLDG
jgi:predicted metal-dependent hydrolase